jgi:site-specific DNA-methyltransferase (adenine-specific)
MKPYYQDSAVTIYHGDCFDVLPELDAGAFAAMVTDPPYASGVRAEAHRTTSGAMVRGVKWRQKPIENDQMTTCGYVWMMREVARDARRLLVEGGSFLAFIDWRNWPNLLGAVESVNLRVNQMVVWDKVVFAMGRGYRAQHELVLWASKGPATVVDFAVGNVLRHQRVGNDDHPAPKPVELLADLMRVPTKEGDTIVDPFMGCGPTLVAAKQTGRKAVGVEIEERYCELAARRCSQEMAFHAANASLDRPAASAGTVRGMVGG